MSERKLEPTPGWCKRARAVMNESYRTNDTLPNTSRQEMAALCYEHHAAERSEPAPAEKPLPHRWSTPTNAHHPVCDYCGYFKFDWWTKRPCPVGPPQSEDKPAPEQPAIPGQQHTAAEAEAWCRSRPGVREAVDKEGCVWSLNTDGDRFVRCGSGFRGDAIMQTWSSFALGYEPYTLRETAPEKPEAEKPEDFIAKTVRAAMNKRNEMVQAFIVETMWRTGKPFESLLLVEKRSSDGLRTEWCVDVKPDGWRQDEPAPEKPEGELPDLLEQNLRYYWLTGPMDHVESLEVNRRSYRLILAEARRIAREEIEAAIKQHCDDAGHANQALIEHLADGRIAAATVERQIDGHFRDEWTPCNLEAVIGANLRLKPGAR